MDTSNRAVRRSGLVRVLPRLALFCLPLLLAWAGLEWIAAGIPSLYSTKREQLRRLSSEVDTLVLGSSAGLYGIAPQELPGCAYNLANYAQSLYYDDQIATASLRELPKLKRVVVALHYISLFSTVEGIAPERQFYYQQEWHIPPERWWYRLDARMWSAIALHTPARTVPEVKAALRRLRHGGTPRVPSTDPNLDDRGWWFAPNTDPRLDLSAAECQRSLAIHHSLMDLSNAPRNMASLEHLVSTLRARNIEVDLVVMPVWHGYFEGMDQEYLRRGTLQFQQLARKYHAFCLCCLNTPSLTEEDFRDVQHLSPIGAVHFTQWVCHALETAQPAH